MKSLNVDAPKSILGNLSAKKSYRWTTLRQKKNQNLNEILSEFHGKEVHEFTLIKRTNLHNEIKEPRTLKLDFKFIPLQLAMTLGTILVYFQEMIPRKLSISSPG